MEKSGLTQDIFYKMNDVFKNYKEIDSVLLYGSRAMGNFKHASDIDLSLVGQEIDLKLQNEIEFALDDLMLPYKFDISIYRKITNPEFIEHIDSVGIEIYKLETFKNPNSY
jgi:predicted nucleotidyltransferase